MSIPAGKRIDAGIKRGPRTRLGQPTSPSHPSDLGTWKIPPDLDPDHVLDQYLVSDTTSDIAKRFGLSRKALVKWLRTVRPKEWKEVQLIRAHVKLDDGEDGIVTSEDALSLARARETVKAAQFRLVSLDTDYQPKQQVTYPGTPTAPQLLADALQLLSLVRDQRKQEEKLIESVEEPKLPDA